ncbi:LytR/AlgR family response regulator transcription factor [Aquimarina algiphila]|uniref:LytR/AlgR family response regulator transcription factor n=1 Tax=Aquimarina algiphila TaxID=2047982 RepID=UPI00232CDFDC|nr:response regulator transcription factor [Aquimarina algiphila]
MKIKAVILEDEASAKDHLIKLIKQITPDISVISSLSTVTEALHWFHTQKHPDLIFMDIHLSDGLSFDILEEVEIDVPIIFITAYDEYAIKAFKTTGIDYLLKPITREDLENAMEKFLKNKNKINEEWIIQNLDLAQLIKKPENVKYKKRFLLRFGNSMIPVVIDDIAYFYRDELVFAKLKDKRSIPIDHALNQLQTMVNPEQFIRLNRQLLVNISAIKKLVPSKPGQLSITLSPEYHTEIQLSSERSRWLKLVLS